MLTPTGLTLPQLPAHPDCTLCPYFEQAKSVGVPSEYVIGSLVPSPTVPAVIFIGQNPGFYEDERNKPWQGKAGNMLRNVYIDGIHLLTRCSVYVANSLRCGPESITAAKVHRICFEAHMVPDLHHIAAYHLPASGHPGIGVVLCSAPAVKAFFRYFTGKGLKQLESFSRQATLVNDSTAAFTVFSTFHPASVLRNNKQIHAVHDHLQLVSDWLDGTLAPPSKPHIVPTRSPPTS